MAELQRYEKDRQARRSSALICTSCGSHAIVPDALARWCAETQQWDVGGSSLAECLVCGELIASPEMGEAASGVSDCVE